MVFKLHDWREGGCARLPGIGDNKSTPRRPSSSADSGCSVGHMSCISIKEMILLGVIVRVTAGLLHIGKVARPFVEERAHLQSNNVKHIQMQRPM